MKKLFVGIFFISLINISYSYHIEPSCYTQNANVNSVGE